LDYLLLKSTFLYFVTQIPEAGCNSGKEPESSNKALKAIIVSFNDEIWWAWSETSWYLPAFAPHVE
jgi:hypothetical protein